MTFEDFKNIYGRLKVASDLVEQNEPTYRNLDAAGALEQMLRAGINDPDAEMPNLQEDSPKTRQAIAAKNLYARNQQDILAYTKSNIDDILKSAGSQNIIRAASLSIQPNPEDESELAQYLYAYRLIDLLKVEEDTEDKNDRSRKRKKRLTGEQRSKLTDMVLPLIVKEKLRAGGKVQDKDLDFYAKTIAYVAALSDRSYVANAMNEGQELLGKRIESIGGVDDYIKNGLKGKDEDEENMKYLSFASSLGEAYQLSEAD